MRTRVLVALLGMLVAEAAFRQGRVWFRNFSDSLLTTNHNGATGPISGVNAYRVGFYIGFLGAQQNDLILAGITTNSSLSPGFFSTALIS
ncbi:MAG TPA: hypothetical protein VNT99_13700 [Methylomirabilota bacterium]|nr:hypothetical protein [Methylomirabilota bacterium]